MLCCRFLRHTKLCLLRKVAFLPVWTHLKASFTLSRFSCLLLNVTLLQTCVFVTLCYVFMRISYVECSHLRTLRKFTFVAIVWLTHFLATVIYLRISLLQFYIGNTLLVNNWYLKSG
jgi:hypothetical protein